MAEQQTATLTDGGAQEALIADLNRLAVRRVHFTDWWKGAGALGDYTPTPSMWRAGRHMELGARIDDLVREGGAAIRLLGVSDGVLPRRVPTNGYFTGWQYSDTGGKPIHHSEVTRVENMDAGRGRLLPVLRLTEFGPKPDDKEYMVSLPDLAHYVQEGEVELTLT